MAATENTFGRKVKTGIDILVGIAVLIAIIFVALPYVKIPTLKDGVIILATDAPVARPTQPVYQPHTGDSGADNPAVPTMSLAQIEATSQAIYHATAQAVNQAQPQPNVDTTNDSAPVVREQKIVEVAPADAGVVPTSLPIPPTPEGGDSFGSKAAPPLNIQAAHQCLHAQIWTDTGCHNPTPVR